MSEIKMRRRSRQVPITLTTSTASATTLRGLLARTKVTYMDNTTALSLLKQTTKENE